MDTRNTNNWECPHTLLWTNLNRDEVEMLEGGKIVCLCFAISHDSHIKTLYLFLQILRNKIYIIFIEECHSLWCNKIIYYESTIKTPIDVCWLWLILHVNLMWYNPFNSSTSLVFRSLSLSYQKHISKAINKSHVCAFLNLLRNIKWVDNNNTYKVLDKYLTHEMYIVFMLMISIIFSSTLRPQWSDLHDVYEIKWS